ncbi:MAG: hypothetical protein U5Q03_18160 [Bacteroidota bacterium]|nr:hypothetical protein [Bacteroidota bacterium]
MLTNINQSNLYNSNKIIDFDTELEPDEVVVGMQLDTIKIKVSEEISERDVNMLFVELSDKKQLIIANINEPEYTRTLSVNETEVIEINDRVVDSLDMLLLKDMSPIAWFSTWQSIEFDEDDEQAVITNFIQDEVRSQLKDQGYLDTT